MTRHPLTSSNASSLAPAAVPDQPAPAGPTQPVDLNQLVAEADLGGRRPLGMAGKVIFAVETAWSLFHLMFVSPLPFILNFVILNDAQALSIHLAIAFFLVFLCYPPFKSSSRTLIPLADLALALIAAFCAGYLF